MNDFKLLQLSPDPLDSMIEIHRLQNAGKIDLVMIEAQVGEYVGEDDIVRIEDDFQRMES